MKEKDNIKSNKDKKKIPVMGYLFVLVVGALNKLTPEEVNNLPYETLNLNTAEGRHYVLIEMKNKARLVYEEVTAEYTPDQIADLHKGIKDRGLKVPGRGSKIITWKLTEDEKKVLFGVERSENPLTVDELVASTGLPLKIAYQSLEALVKLKEIEEFGEAGGYTDGIPRYGMKHYEEVST